MSEETAIQQFRQESLVDIWKDPGEIKRLFAPKLSDAEFSYFMGLSKATGANPFMKEIWAVKYGTEPAQIFHARDYYRRKAQELEQYEGHTVDAVFENDTFSVKNGIPSHSYNIGKRGRLMGAYCVVYVKGRSVPFFNFAELQEYDTGKSTWKKMPATMIKKVAEAQALRGAFQGVFQGTYSDVEQWDDETVVDVTPQEPQNTQQTSEEDLEKAYAAIEPFYDGLHPEAVKNSTQLHLGTDTLRECTDLGKLRDLYRHKKKQHDAKETPVDVPKE